MKASEHLQALQAMLGRLKPAIPFQRGLVGRDLLAAAERVEADGSLATIAGILKMRLSEGHEAVLDEHGVYSKIALDMLRSVGVGRAAKADRD